MKKEIKTAPPSIQLEGPPEGLIKIHGSTHCCFVKIFWAMIRLLNKGNG